jgi:hypothetical protein
MKIILSIRRITVTLAATAAAVGLLLTAGSTLAGSDVLFTGGGIIKDGSGAAARRISFSVNLFVNADGVRAGHLGFHFHNLDDIYGLDQSRFTTSEFDSVFIETAYLDTTPYTFVRIEARGRLDGADGWSVLARFSDFGVPVNNKALNPGHADALRVILFDPSGVPVYDTALDYPKEQSWRTWLDGGNVAVDMKFAPDL